MSAKSRKRNRRLAALAGLAGAVALANRKPKQSDVSQDSGRGSGLRPTVDTAKKDTTVKTKTTIQDNKSKDTAKKPIPGIRVDKNSITASKYDKDTPNKTFSGPDKKYDYVNRASEKNTAGIAKPKKGLMATVFPKSGAADEFKASTQDYNRGDYKSGGRVKGCGKALRGFGKAMKGKR
jgi:hypothetical protein